MAEESGVDVQETEGKQGSALTFIIIGLVVLILGAAGFVGWKLFMQNDDGGAAEPVAVSEVVVTENPVGKSFPLETFVVNLNDPGGTRYLKTQIELEYVGEIMVEELQQRLPQLRDVILLLLSSKRLDEIQGVDGKIALRRELINRINQTLKTGKVRNIYFTQFVIQ